jgi:glycosyltransferase involved in cell wall biosynthesis
MSKVSILIPTFSNKGLNHLIIQTTFRSIAGQYFKDYETVVADQSTDDATEQVCEQWKDKINLKYFRNPNSTGGAAQNENWCIKNATGDILKFLDSDDFFMLPTSLGTTVEAFTPDTMWLATKYFHSYDRINLINEHSPVVNPKLYIVNTIGTPSCVSMRNMGDENVMFDENLRWMIDCEMYARMITKFGPPKLLDVSTVIHYLWGGQFEHTVKMEEMVKETEYVLGIHEP